jgi:hypothetical protein
MDLARQSRFTAILPWVLLSQAWFPCGLRGQDASGGFFGGIEDPPRRSVLASRDKVHFRTPNSPRAARTWAKLEKAVPVRFEEIALEDFLAFVRRATAGEANDDPGVPICLLMPAQTGQAEYAIPPISIDLEGLPLRRTLELALHQATFYYVVDDDGVVFIRPDWDNKRLPDPTESVLDELHALRSEVSALRKEVSASRGRTLRPKAANPAHSKQAGPEVRGSLSPDAERALTAIPGPETFFHKPLTPRAARTWAKLEKLVPMPFANEIPYAEFLEHVTEATANPAQNDPGIQIYMLYPPFQGQVHISMQIPITIDLQGIPLWKTLGLVLHDVGETYSVHDDGLVIISPGGYEHDLLDPTERVLDELHALRKDVAASRRRALSRETAIPTPSAGGDALGR